MQKHVRDFKRMLDGEGLRLLALKQARSGHYKAHIADDKGNTLTYTLAVSAADHRAALNCKKDITRFFNN